MIRNFLSKNNPNLLSDFDMAWLAGFVDGEGYIGIVKARKKPNRQNSASWLYHPWIIVTNTNIEVLDYIQSVVPSQKRAFLRSTRVRKMGYQVKITKLDDVIDLLGILRPYLRVKKKQAKLLIKFCQARKKAKIITGRGSRGQTSFGDFEEKIYNQLRKLNKRGI